MVIVVGNIVSKKYGNNKYLRARNGTDYQIQLADLFNKSVCYEGNLVEGKHGYNVITGYFIKPGTLKNHTPDSP